MLTAHFQGACQEVEETLDHSCLKFEYNQVRAMEFSRKHDTQDVMDKKCKIPILHAGGLARLDAFVASLTKVAAKGHADVKLLFPVGSHSLNRFLEERTQYHKLNRQHFKRGLVSYIRAVLTESMHNEIHDPSRGASKRARTGFGVYVKTEAEGTEVSGKAPARGGAGSSTGTSMTVVGEAGSSIKTGSSSGNMRQTSASAPPHFRSDGKSSSVGQQPMGDSRIVGSDGGVGGRHRPQMSPSEIHNRMKEFKHVSANVYESKEARQVCKQMRDSLGVCQCPKGSRCVAGECTLRGQQIECSVQTCSRACTNLGGHNIPRLYIDFSPIAGTGLFTDDAVEEGQEIGRYDGKIVTPEEKQRLEERRGAAACSYFIEHKPAPTPLYIDG
ncbi:MAG: hypothetical protein ACPIOQ_64475, partial [Promethearchaeia archaeon]